MTIRNRFSINVCLSAGVVLIIGLAFLLVLQREQKADAYSSITGQLMRGAFQLNSISDFFVRHPEPRPKAQWKMLYDSLVNSLKSLPHLGEQPETIVRRMNQNLGTMETLFAELVETNAGKRYPRSGSAPAVTAQETAKVEQLAELIAMNARGVSWDAARLDEYIRSETMRINKAITQATITASFLLMAFVLWSSMLLGKSISAPLGRLRDGVNIIGAGNLEHQIGIASEDEIGELALAFDDMTRRIRDAKEAQSCINEALRRANAYNRNIIEASLDPLVTLNPEGEITDLNLATERLTGRSRVELLGRDFAECFTEPQKYRAAYERVCREGFVRNEPLEILHRDGEIASVLYNASVYRDESGKVNGVFSAARDITERKRAEEARWENEARFRMMIESVKGYAIFMLDATGHVVSWNSGAQRIKGYRETEIIGRHFSIFYTREDAEGGKPERNLAIAVAEGRYEEEGWRIGKNQHRFMADIIITALFDAAGNLRGFAKVTRDVTELKKAEEAIKHYMEELERSNGELQQFAYVASHDLQEPLRMVSSYTQLLAQRYQGQLDDKANKYIEYAVDGANRMQQLINDLLFYSRINTRGTTPGQTDSHAVLGEALRNLSAAIEEGRALIANDDLPIVCADPSQLAQLFQNLIGNAIKFRGADLPRILVSARDLGQEWCFSVKDNGIGIDPQFAEKVFTIFQRLHTRQEYPGTGIGLAVCKRIVTRHGGRIWFESEPGQGCTFYFTLPKKGVVP